MPRKPLITYEERRIMFLNGPNCTCEEMQKLLPNRDVRSMARRMGVKLKPMPNVAEGNWTAEEDAILRRCCDHMSARDIADMLPGRNRFKVIGRCHRLGLSTSGTTRHMPDSTYSTTRRAAALMAKRAKLREELRGDPALRAKVEAFMAYRARIHAAQERVRAAQQ